MFGEEIARDGMFRSFVRHGFDAVLAELEHLSPFVRARPRATLAVETALLVDIQPRPQSASDPHLAHSETHALVNRRNARRDTVNVADARTLGFFDRFRARHIGEMRVLGGRRLWGAGANVTGLLRHGVELLLVGRIGVFGGVGSVCSVRVHEERRKNEEVQASATMACVQAGADGALLESSPFAVRMRCSPA